MGALRMAISDLFARSDADSSSMIAKEIRRYVDITVLFISDIFGYLDGRGISDSEQRQR